MIEQRKHKVFSVVAALFLLCPVMQSCGDEKADSKYCRDVCRIIQRCESQAYVDEERLAACYAGCDKGSIYLKEEYSVCVVAGGGCDDFYSCLAAVDSGEYDKKSSGK